MEIKGFSRKMFLGRKGLVSWRKISRGSTRMSRNSMICLILNIIILRLFWNLLRWLVMAMNLSMRRVQSILGRVRIMRQILSLWNLLLVEVIMMKLIWKVEIYIIKLVVSLKLIKLKEIERGWRLAYLLLHQIKLIWLRIK